jgi:hypothetical protein
MNPRNVTKSIGATIALLFACSCSPSTDPKAQAPNSVPRGLAAMAPVAAFAIADAGADAPVAEQRETGPRTRGCDPDLPIRDREACLLGVTPASQRWERIGKLKPPFGYVCVFFGIRDSPTCEQDGVRAIGRWRSRRGTDTCGSEMALYWAAARGPHRPDVDATGMMAIPSDGRVFYYLEADDYIVEAETGPACQTTVRDDLRDWAARLRTALNLR